MYARTTAMSVWWIALLLLLLLLGVCCIPGTSVSVVIADQFIYDGCILILKTPRRRL